MYRHNSLSIVTMSGLFVIDVALASSDPERFTLMHVKNELGSLRLRQRRAAR
jgi:hypothetical protein